MSSSSSATARRRRPLHSLPPTEILEIGSGLSLCPRLKLLLTFFRADPAVKPIDEWKLRLSLLDFLRSSLSLSVPDDDLLIRKRSDLHKRKRNEPVAFGTLYVRELGFLKSKTTREEDRDEEDDEELLQRKFLNWRSSVVERLAGIELNLEGVKFEMSVEIPSSDDFEKMEESWKKFYAGNSASGVARRPDTIIVRGVPSRWFAEPRVSSKASMLVTHTIFSVFGKIRNLNVGGDDDLGKKAEDADGEIVSGLNCKVWVQFEHYSDFYNAMKVLCGRSMQKEGSRLKVDYEVTWDRDGFFRSVLQKTAQSYGQERGASMQMMAGHIRNETMGRQSQNTRFDSDGGRSKRFRLPSISHLSRTGPALMSEVFPIVLLGRYHTLV
ncbi:uncharacterized protein [Elaeis guineensis]